MAEAVAAGVPTWRFYDMTPRELYATLVGHSTLEKRLYKLALYGAWHAGAFGRVKKIPDLAAMLRKMDPPRVRSSPKQIRSSILAIAEAMGAKVTIKKKGA